MFLQNQASVSYMMHVHSKIQRLWRPYEEPWPPCDWPTGNLQTSSALGDKDSVNVILPHIFSHSSQKEIDGWVFLNREYTIKIKKVA